MFKETYLSDIGLDSTVTLNGTDIVNSWTNTSTSDEYVMNYVNRGLNHIYKKRANTRADTAATFSTNNETKIAHFEEFNPDLFVKTILKKSFNSIGYNFSSSFFDADASALIHSEISENYKKNDTADSYLEVGASTTSISVTSRSKSLPVDLNQNPASYPVTFKILPFDTEISDANNNYNNSTYAYTVPREGLYDIELILNFTNLYPQNIQFPTTDILEFSIWKADIGGQYDLDLVGVNRIVSPTATPAGSMELSTFDWYSAIPQWVNGTIEDLYLLETDVLYFGISVLDPAYPEDDGVSYYTGITYFDINAGCSLKITEKQDIVRNNTFNLADVVDSSKHSILNLIQDYTTAFNLYWRTDNLTKTIYCEPRDEFYNSLTTAKDWTNKIDISSYSLVPLSSQFNRYLSFNYLEDSNDGYVQEVNKNAVLNYGTYQHDLGSNFKVGETNINMIVYAPSLTIDGDSNAYSGSVLTNAPSTSRLWNENLIEIPEFNSKFAPRLLNYNYDNSQTIQYETQTGTKAISNTSSSPSPCGLFTSNIVSSKKNLLFATINAQNGLFKAHYQKTFDLINNGFVLNIDANLSNTDISNYKLNDVIYFAAPFDLKGYWVIQEIGKIQPLQKGLVSLSLI